MPHQSSPPTSSNSRTAILQRIRQSLQVNATGDNRLQAVQTRLAQHTPNLVPELENGHSTNMTERFQGLLESQGTTVLRASDLDDVPQAVSNYLRQHNLPLRLRHGKDDLMARIPWDVEAVLTRDIGRADPQDHTSISVASLGIAETGTLVLLSGAANPTTLNFLPENHIILLPYSRMTESYERAWESLRQTYGDTYMPRALCYISGPSRTADIEQTLIQGAHGPCRLCVIIIHNA